jgi:hypothetical protein
MNSLNRLFPGYALGEQYTGSRHACKHPSAADVCRHKHHMHLHTASALHIAEDRQAVVLQAAERLYAPPSRSLM